MENSGLISPFEIKDIISSHMLAYQIAKSGDLGNPVALESRRRYFDERQFLQYLESRFGDVKEIGLYPDHDIETLITLTIEEGLVSIQELSKFIQRSKSTITAWAEQRKFSWINISYSNVRRCYRMIKPIFLEEYETNLEQKVVYPGQNHKS